MGKINGMKNFIFFLSAYRPCECGLVSFATDLVKEITAVTLIWSYIMAVNKDTGLMK